MRQAYLASGNAAFLGGGGSSEPHREAWCDLRRAALSGRTVGYNPASLELSDACSGRGRLSIALTSDRNALQVDALKLDIAVSVQYECGSGTDSAK
jgi:hypothetical protein